MGKSLKRMNLAVAQQVKRMAWTCGQLPPEPHVLPLQTNAFIDSSDSLNPFLFSRQYLPSNYLPLSE